jgi:prephenate dehydratase
MSLTVAIAGTHGSYSEEAAIRMLGREAEMVECAGFDIVFNQVLTGRARYAAIPMRNKIVGEIETNRELLKKTAFSVVDRIRLDIEHVLAGTHDAELVRLRAVRSHTEALKQCRRFFKLRPSISKIPGRDTAESIRQIVQHNDPTIAAIGSRRAAEVYGAKILMKDIADDAANWTEFYLLARADQDVAWRS